MKRMILAAALCCAVFPAAAQQADSSTRVYDLAEVERQPVPTNLDALRTALDATYPADKRAAGQGARVSVAFVLSPKGVPRELSVMQSTDAAFDSVTVAALTLLRFQPATVGGRPVAVRVEVPVEWRVGTQAPEPPSAAAAAAGEGDETAADGVRVYALSEVDEPPRPTNVGALRRELERLYPGSLRNLGIAGTVQVNFVVTEAGEVEDVLITRTTDLRFNVATIQAIGVLRFTPGRVDGRAVRTRVELPIQWEAEKPARPQNDGRSPAWRLPAEP
jgi:TonB family protein